MQYNYKTISKVFLDEYSTENTYAQINEAYDQSVLKNKLKTCANCIRRDLQAIIFKGRSFLSGNTKLGESIFSSAQHKG